MGMNLLLSAEPTPMGSLLAQLVIVCQTALTQVGNICTTIVSNPLLLMCTGLLLLGGCIGIVGRLLSRN